MDAAPEMLWETGENWRKSGVWIELNRMPSSQRISLWAVISRWRPTWSWFSRVFWQQSFFSVFSSPPRLMGTSSSGAIVQGTDRTSYDGFRLDVLALWQVSGGGQQFQQDRGLQVPASGAGEVLLLAFQFRVFLSQRHSQINLRACETKSVKQRIPAIWMPRSAEEYINKNNKTINKNSWSGRVFGAIREYPRNFDLFLCHINIFFCRTGHSNNSGQNLRSG